jgi:hypothetical protein
VKWYRQRSRLCAGMCIIKNERRCGLLPPEFSVCVYARKISDIINKRWCVSMHREEKFIVACALMSIEFLRRVPRLTWRKFAYNISYLSLSAQWENSKRRWKFNTRSATDVPSSSSCDMINSCQFTCTREISIFNENMLKIYCRLSINDDYEREFHEYPRRE